MHQTRTEKAKIIGVGASAKGKLPVLPVIPVTIICFSLALNLLTKAALFRLPFILIECDLEPRPSGNKQRWVNINIKELIALKPQKDAGLVFSSLCAISREYAGCQWGQIFSHLAAHNVHTQACIQPAMYTTTNARRGNRYERHGFENVMATRLPRMLLPFYLKRKRR